jgi:hypothetical protein
VLLFEAPDRCKIRLGGLAQGPVAGLEWIFHDPVITSPTRGVTPLYFGHGHKVSDGLLFLNVFFPGCDDPVPNATGYLQFLLDRALLTNTLTHV